MENPIKNGWFGGNTIFGNIQLVVSSQGFPGHIPEGIVINPIVGLF